MKRHTIMIYVKDVGVMARFYREVVQLALIKEAADWAEFDAGGFILALHAIPASVAARIEITQPPRPRQDTPIKVLFHVDDLKAARGRLRSAAAELPSPSQGGGEPTRVDGIDPEGNIFTVFGGA